MFSPFGPPLYHQTLVQNYKLRCYSQQRNSHHPQVTTSVSGPNILLNTVFSGTFN